MNLKMKKWKPSGELCVTKLVSEPRFETKLYCIHTISQFLLAPVKGTLKNPVIVRTWSTKRLQRLLARVSTGTTFPRVFWHSLSKTLQFTQQKLNIYWHTYKVNESMWSNVHVLYNHCIIIKNYVYRIKVIHTIYWNAHIKQNIKYIVYKEGHIYMFSVSLKNNWHTSMHEFKAHSMMIWFAYIIKWLPL